MNIQQIVGFTHLRVLNLFHYVSDQKNYGVNEDWRSHADAVNRKEVFKDDCDGFALTCAELILEEGIPRDRVKIIICKTEEGEQHLVCGVDIDDDVDFGKTTLICDNRNAHVKAWNQMPKYTWQFYMRMDEPGKWHEVN
jgi:predicted transglutaminase-like cysteine proteinase